MLVCGSRKWTDRETLYRWLDYHKPDEIIEGGSGGEREGKTYGADRMAREWAGERGVPCMTFPADWDTYGKKAGPIRNQQMLDEGQPDEVLAFPLGKSKGTRDMMERALKAGITVNEYVHPRREDSLGEWRVGCYPTPAGMRVEVVQTA